MKAGKSKSVERKLGGNPIVQFKTEGSLLQNSVLLRERRSFLPLRFSTGWVRSTHTMEDSLLTQNPLV